MQKPVRDNDVTLFSTEKENQYFDRKSARLKAQETARHISAFANASGGKLVIGIEDNGEVTGFKRNGACNMEDFEQAALVGCEPMPEVHPIRIPVTNSHGEDDSILVLDISASSNHVIARRSDKAVFLRQQDSSGELDRDQVLALEYDKNQRRYEDEVQERSSIEDIDPEVMARYKAKLGTDTSDEQVLRSRGFLQDSHLTNAGILLFAANPGRFMPWARVRVIRFDSNKRSCRLSWSKRQDITPCSQVSCGDGASRLAWQQRSRSVSVLLAPRIQVSQGEMVRVGSSRFE